MVYNLWSYVYGNRGVLNRDRYVLFLFFSRSLDRLLWGLWDVSWICETDKDRRMGANGEERKRMPDNFQSVGDKGA